MTRRLLWLIFLVPALPSCRRDGPIETYRVPKESTPVPLAPADPHAGVAMPGAAGGDPHAGMPAGGEVVKPMVRGELPAHWKPAGGSSMRLAR